MTIRTRDFITQESHYETVVQHDDILKTIFSHLNFNDLIILDLVSRQWNALASNPAWLKERIYEEMAFGIREWKFYGEEKFLGNAVDERKALPDTIGKIFKSLCPVDKDFRKRVWETHSLVWVDKAMNLRNYGELAEKHLPMSNHGYQYIFPKLITAEVDESTDESHWMLVTNDLLPESRGKNYKAHENTVAVLAKKAKPDYSMPTRFEAVAYVLTRLLISKAKEFPFGGKWTDCQKEKNGRDLWINGCRVIVGGPSPAGLDVDYYYSGNDYDDVGVAALRKFYWSSVLGNLGKGWPIVK